MTERKRKKKNVEAGKARSTILKLKIQQNYRLKYKVNRLKYKVTLFLSSNNGILVNDGWLNVFIRFLY